MSFQRDFKNFVKLWPNQLDLLTGPLLEDDDDDEVAISEVQDMQQHEQAAPQETIKDGQDLCDEKCSSNVHNITSLLSAKMSDVYKTGNINGMPDMLFKYRNVHSSTVPSGVVVYIERNKDTDEEIDIETIEDEVPFTRSNPKSKNIQKSNVQIAEKVNKKEYYSNGVSQDENLGKTNSYKAEVIMSPTINDTALEASDLVSLLEKFEASEQMQVDNDSTLMQTSNLKLSTTKYNSQSVNGLKSKGLLTASVVERIKTSSPARRGSILIPPEHIQRPRILRATNNKKMKYSQNGQPPPVQSNEKSVSFPNQGCPSFVHSSISDHDYCSPLRIDANSNNQDSCDYDKIPAYLQQINAHSLENDKFGPSLNNKCDSDIETVVIDNLVNNHPDSGENNALIKVTGNNELDNSIVETMATDTIILVEENEVSSNKDTTTVTDVIHDSHFEDSSSQESSSSPKSLQSEFSSVDNKCLIKSQSPHRTQCIESYNSPLLNVSQLSDSNSQNSSWSWACDKYLESQSPLPQNKPKSSFKSHSQPQNKRARFHKWENRSNHQDKCSVQFEKMKQIEERRVVYVGNIPDGMTRDELRKRFSKFGLIQEVSIHFRDHGDNYGFVTFIYRSDAYKAVEHGNDDPSLPKFDLCFGGRRQFCITRYEDLDDVYEEDVFFYPQSNSTDFDALLKAAQAKMSNGSFS